MKSFFKKHYWIFISVLIVLLDQLTKYMISSAMELHDEIPVITDFFAITHIHNEGIAFGMLSEYGAISKILVAVLTLVLIVVATVLLIKGSVRHPIGVVSIAMIIGGGIGNLIDRVFLRYVVDFFAFTFFGKDFAVFNVADIFVTVGTALFVIYFLFLEKSKEEQFDGNQEISDN